MPYTKVYVHFVWTTKNKFPFLNSYDLRKTLWNHIKENAKRKNIFIDRVNGHVDHCHCLISLGVEQSMSKVMQLIKGESSFWMNKNSQTKSKFEWQDEYFAVSVSESVIDRVRTYIDYQEHHHANVSLEAELRALADEYGFGKIENI